MNTISFLLSATLVLAQTFKAGDFQCVDDTKFKQFTSASSFVISSCPPGFCFTRSPALKNPCIGKDRAQAIDGTGGAEAASTATTAATTAATVASPIVVITTSSFAATIKAASRSTSSKSPGTQFITGPCTADADCASGCCEKAQNICRAPLSLTPGVQSCKDGRTPEFNKGPAHFVQISQ